MENRYFLIEKKIKDLISYINIYSKHLPKHEKYVLGEKLRRLSYEILELAITVNKKVFKKTDLTQLNIKHEILRQLVEVSYDLGYVDRVQRYHHLSLLIDELGKMIGSWIKKLPKSGIGKLKQGVDFVGFRTWKNKRLIRKQSLFRIRRALKKGFNHNQVCSFLAHAKDTNSLNYIKNIIDKYKESSNVNS